MENVGLASFILIMLGLGALPSASVALVVARSSTHGLANGIAASLGIVAGDLLFIAMALLGVTAIAESFGALFATVRYVAAAYLVWFGYSLFRSGASEQMQRAESGASTLGASALAGFTLTLGDVKAILFYASLFPTLFDLPSLTCPDVFSIVIVTVLTLGGVKIAYAIAARRIAEKLSDNPHEKHLKRLIGGVLMSAGAYLVVKS